MAAPFNWLIPLALAAVTAVLITGVVSMFRGGEFDRRNANKLMQLRVVLQFAAIMVLMAALMLSG